MVVANICNSKKEKKHFWRVKKTMVVMVVMVVEIFKMV